MRQTLITLSLVAYSVVLHAQFGVSGGYKSLQAEEWVELANLLTEENFENPSGYNVGLDYWFRIKNFRIEFFPTVSWSALESSSSMSNLEMTLLGFHLNTNLYPFDLEGDCDCPTWSKSGGLFQKGFFIQATPGYVRNKIKVTNHPVNIQDFDVSYFEIGVGAGLDIGVSDLLTITPLVRYQVAQGVEYTPVSNSLIDFGPTDANLKQWFAGIRIGFRFDE